MLSLVVDEAYSEISSTSASHVEPNSEDEDSSEQRYRSKRVHLQSSRHRFPLWAFPTFYFLMTNTPQKGSSHGSDGPAANGAAQRRRAGIYVAPDSIEARWAADIARQGLKESADQEAGDWSKRDEFQTEAVKFQISHLVPGKATRIRISLQSPLLFFRPFPPRDMSSVPV